VAAPKTAGIMQEASLLRRMFGMVQTNCGVGLFLIFEQSLLYSDQDASTPLSDRIVTAGR
jgi:hypothetical protein